jgi:hypothetical protein
LLVYTPWIDTFYLFPSVSKEAFMKKFTVLLFCLAMLLVLPKSSPAMVITFDDLPTLDPNGSPNPYSGKIPFGYGGLNWTNFSVINTATNANISKDYAVGCISDSNVAAGSLYEQISSSIKVAVPDTTFVFNSAYFALATFSFTSPPPETFGTLILTGYNASGGVQVSSNIELNNTSNILFTPTHPTDWLGLSKLTFSHSGGAVTIDNLTINEPINTPVPIPDTATLVLSGLGFVVITAGQRKKLHTKYNR